MNILAILHTPIPPDDPTPMRPTEQAAWSAKLVKLNDTQLATVRKVAAVWTSTIGTLTGVSVVLGVLTQRDAIAKLSGGYQIAIGVLFGLATLCALIAVYRGARAAMGSLVPIVGTPRALRYTVTVEPLRTLNAIKDSMLATLLSVLLLFAAIYLTWIGTATTAAVPDAYLMPAPAAGAVYCGTLSRDRRSARILLAPAHGLAPLPVRDPATLVKVSACP